MNELLLIRNAQSAASDMGRVQDRWCTLVYCHFGTRGQRGERRKRHEESSCHQEDFVADKVKANSFRPGPIKKERRGRLQHVLAQIVPRGALGEDVFRKAFGAVAGTRLLNNLGDQLSHSL